jgi:hypothetical protein
MVAAHTEKDVQKLGSVPDFSGFFEIGIVDSGKV